MFSKAQTQNLVSYRRSDHTGPTRRWTTLNRCQQQFLAAHKQVVQRTGGEQSVPILLQPGDAPSRIRTSASSPETHARPSPAPSISSGSTPRPLHPRSVLVTTAPLGVVPRSGATLANQLSLPLINAIAHTRVSSPCSRSGKITPSDMFAAVATTLWMILVLLSTPRALSSRNPPMLYSISMIVVKKKMF